MLRFNVIEQKESSPIDCIKNPTGNVLEQTDFYKEKMKEASERKTEILNFESIPFTEKKSDNFQNVYIVEKCIMDYLIEQEYPKKVQIVCDSSDTAELYKVVYNFYYPGSKAERLDDKSWD